MEFLESDYNRIVSIKDTDDAFDEMMQTFESIAKYYNMKKYESMTESEIKSFKTSTMWIFKCLKYCMTLEDSEVEDFNEEELERYNSVNSNIENVVNTIMECNLEDQESSTYQSLLKIFEHFELINKDIEDQNKIMSNFVDSLEETTNTLSDVLKISEINSSLENLTYQMCVEYLDWCEKTLEKYDNLETIKEYLKDHSYLEDFKNNKNLDSEKKDEMAKLMSVENILKIQNHLENRYPNLKLNYLSDNVKNNTFDENDLASDIKWCKEQLALFKKEDVLHVLKDFSEGNKIDYSEFVNKAIEENDKEVLDKYINYVKIFNITNIMFYFEIKQKTANP